MSLLELFCDVDDFCQQFDIKLLLEFLVLPLAFFTCTSWHISPYAARVACNYRLPLPTAFLSQAKAGKTAVLTLEPPWHLFCSSVHSLFVDVPTKSAPTKALAAAQHCALGERLSSAVVVRV